MDSKRNDLIQLNEDLRKCLHNIMRLIRGASSGNDFIAILALVKSYKTIGSINAIFRDRAGYGEDAFVLCRTILESLITTKYILSDSTGKEIERFAEYDWIIREHSFEALKLIDPDKANWLEQNPDTPIAQNEPSLSELRLKAAAAKKKYKFNNSSWSNVSLMNMAKSVGLLKEWATYYRLQSQLAHLNIRGMEGLYSFKNGAIILNTENSELWVNESLSSAFGFSFQLAQITINQFKIEAPDCMTELKSRFEQIMSK